MIWLQISSREVFIYCHFMKEILKQHTRVSEDIMMIEAARKRCWCKGRPVAPEGELCAKDFTRNNRARFQQNHTIMMF